MGALILLRHGESDFNAAQIFTGLLESRLTQAGIDQVQIAARLIQACALHPDLIVTSPMLRARQTLDALGTLLPLEHLEETETITTWRLAERDYGCLTGLGKAECRRMFGEEAFFTWRRTMHGRPPAASAEQRASWVDPPPLADSEPLVAGSGESLADVAERVRPLWAETLQPEAAAGRVILVVAHGNTLRALADIIWDMTDEEVEQLNIPAGHPLVVDVAPDGTAAPGRYLDDDAAQSAADAVAAEGGT